MDDHRILGSLSPISWRLVAQALEFYQRNGFQYLEVPWAVADAAVSATLPPEREATKYLASHQLSLVGSAEQSFLAMMMANEISHGKYVAATPCFRDDPLTKFHQKTFFKVELIEICLKPPEADSVSEMINVAKAFFQDCLGTKTDLIETSDGFDLEVNGVEVGSYGQRSLHGWHWIYGTGLAEPRFSKVYQLKE